MKWTMLITVLVYALTCMDFASADQYIEDSDLGLSKTDVFETPTPQAANYNPSGPGANESLPVAYPTLPPQIPHNIEAFVPITAERNACAGCHHNPSMMGKRIKGMPVPMPASHYTDLRNAPEKVTQELIGARYTCNQCHVPQADAKPLVVNTFK